jgi:hypothetical protein
MSMKVFSREKKRTTREEFAVHAAGILNVDVIYCTLLSITLSNAEEKERMKNEY